MPRGQLRELRRMTTLTIATRGSKLALWQAEHVRTRILAAFPEMAIELLVLKTRGDAILDVPLAQVGGKGLFVKEIEDALLEGKADLAVHSMKDMPMTLPPSLELGAILERFDPRDMFLSARYSGIDDLPEGARVGTSSLRRTAQLLALRRDITVTPLRGNIDTRLHKLIAGEFDAVVMAAAGIRRLGLVAPYMRAFDTAAFLPAAGQGALGVEYQKDRKDLYDLMRTLDHPPSRACVSAERAFLGMLDGGCHTPIAAYATEDAHFLSLTGSVLSLDGTKKVKKQLALPKERFKLTQDNGFKPSDAAVLGQRLAEIVAEAGGRAILHEILAIPR